MSWGVGDRDDDYADDRWMEPSPPRETEWTNRSRVPPFKPGSPDFLAEPLAAAEHDQALSGETRSRRPVRERRQPDAGAFASAFGAELGIGDQQSIDRLALIIDILGARLAGDLLAEVHAIEADGGMWSHDQKRRKTPLGVFFFLAWQQMTDAERREAWPELTALVAPPVPEPTRRSRPAPAPVPQLAPPAPLSSPAQHPSRDVAPPASPARPQPQEPPHPPESMRPSRSLARVQPETEHTRVILFGRPSVVAERGSFVRVEIEGGPAPSLPPGLPRPPKRSTTYVVYILTEQWQQVRDAVERQGQMLIIRGWHTYDPMLNAITVWALAVTAGASL